MSIATDALVQDLKRRVELLEAEVSELQAFKREQLHRQLRAPETAPEDKPNGRAQKR